MKKAPISHYFSLLGLLAATLGLVSSASADVPIRDGIFGIDRLGYLGDSTVTGEVSNNIPSWNYTFIAAKSGETTVQLSYSYSFLPTGSALLSVNPVGGDKFDVIKKTTAGSFPFPSTVRRTATFDAVAGTEYWINVAKPFLDSGEDYTLKIDAPDRNGDALEPNNSIAGATQLGIQGRKTIEDLSIDIPGEKDFFKVTSAEAGTASFAVTYSRRSFFQTGRLKLTVVDRDCNELAEGSGKDVTNGSNTKTAKLNLSAGETVFVRIEGVDLAIKSNYTFEAALPFSDDEYENNDTWDEAAPLDPLENGYRQTLSNLKLGTTGDDDWFRFTAMNDGNANISLRYTREEDDPNFSIDLTTYLLANGTFDPVAALAPAADATGPQGSALTRTLEASESYAIHVSSDPFTHPADYSVTIRYPDRFEPNSKLESASDLGQLGTRSETNLNIHPKEEDWFEFQAMSGGTATVSISHPVLLLGPANLRLKVFQDSDGGLLERAVGVVTEPAIPNFFTRTLRATFDVSPNVLYQILVEGDTPSSENSYSLSINSPVEKVAPEVQWDSPADIVYGAALGGAQLNASSAVAGSFTYDPPAGTVLGAGNNQALTATFTPNDLDTYTTRDLAVKLDVHTAILTVRADNKERRIGQPNPAFTATMSGFQNGDTRQSLDLMPAFITGPIDGVGEYVIAASVGPTPNYIYKYLNGILTVSDLEIPDVDWPAPAPITYGTALGNGQLRMSSGGIPGNITYSPPAGSIFSAGTHMLEGTFTPTDTERYSNLTLAVELEVQPAPLTIRASDREIQQGDPLPGYRATFTGLVNGDTTTDLGNRPSIRHEATLESEPGDYPIHISGGAAANYVITHEPGTLTILPGEPFSFPELHISHLGRVVTVSWENTPGIVLTQTTDLASWRVAPGDTQVADGIASREFNTDGKALASLFFRLAVQ